MRIVLDTHAWVWWVTNDARLSRRARRAIDQAGALATLSLSPISIWELAKKVEKRQLVIDRPLRTWVDAAVRHGGLTVVELSPAILIDSCELPQPFRGDPADQIIVATARSHRAAVASRDENLRRYDHVQTIW